MPPRKSTSSNTPAEADETAGATPTATQQQLKAQAEGGVNVEVSLHELLRLGIWHHFEVLSFLHLMHVPDDFLESIRVYQCQNGT